jgi:hypothetical protein
MAKAPLATEHPVPIQTLKYQARHLKDYSFSNLP